MPTFIDTLLNPVYNKAAILYEKKMLGATLTPGELQDMSDATRFVKEFFGTLSENLNKKPDDLGAALDKKRVQTESDLKRKLSELIADVPVSLQPDTSTGTPSDAAGAGGSVVSGVPNAPMPAADIFGSSASDASDDMIRMEEFFETVSTSLMQAQAKLNERSIDYVTNLDPRFPPAYYGIPSVKAEMRVGFSASKGKGVNLVLFSNTEQKMRYGESTVSFEVVGTPPPPGAPSFGDYVVPVPRFLVTGVKRGELLARVSADRKIDQTVYANARDSALVLRYERGGIDPGEPTKYLIIWPAQRTAQPSDSWHTLAVVHVEERTEKDGSTTLIYPGDPNFPDAKKDSIFEFPPVNQLLTPDPTSPGKLVTLDSLRKLDATKLSQQIINLGDVLVSLCLLVNGWLQAVRYQPKTAAPPTPPPIPTPPK